MENKNQIELLANTALESKNYSQAYDYFSKLIETETNNKAYWIGKAISAGYLTTLENPKISETLACLRMTNKISNFSNQEKNQISVELTSIAKQKIIEAIAFIDKEIEKEFNAIPFPTGTLYEVQKLRKLPIMSSVGGRYRNSMIEYFELLDFSSEINSTKEAFQTTIEQFNKVFTHSKQRSNYFGGVYDNEYNAKIFKIWKNAEMNIKKIDPNANVSYNSSDSSSGCFIATATTGDYNHPTVMQLRLFRDNTLEKHIWGRKFIQFYYRNSPPIADFINQKYLLKKILYFSFIKPLSVLTRYITKQTF